MYRGSYAFSKQYGVLPTLRVHNASAKGRRASLAQPKVSTLLSNARVNYLSNQRGVRRYTPPATTSTRLGQKRT